MDPNRKPSDPDSFGPGMKADGSVNIMTPEEAAVARETRDVENATFDEVLDDDDGDFTEEEIKDITGA